MLGTRERIIADERYHTCGRCKWDGLSDEMYPCNQCVHGLDTRKDFWEYAESEEQGMTNKDVIKRIIIKSLESADDCELADFYEKIVSCGDCPYWSDCRNEHECAEYILDKLEVQK